MTRRRLTPAAAAIAALIAAPVAALTVGSAIGAPAAVGPDDDQAVAADSSWGPRPVSEPKRG